MVDFLFGREKKLLIENFFSFLLIQSVGGKLFVSNSYKVHQVQFESLRNAVASFHLRFVRPDDKSLYNYRPLSLCARSFQRSLIIFDDKLTTDRQQIYRDQ